MVFHFRDHCCAIELPVCLGARSLDCWSLASVEEPELDARPIRHAAHDAVERIDFAHKMPLAQTPDCRVAGHDANAFPRKRDENHARASARRCMGCIRTGMAATDHNHDWPRLFHVKHRFLLANAEIGEDFIKNMLDIHASGKGI
jgi:hypothetical protein